jgi:hypothetical protein
MAAKVIHVEHGWEDGGAVGVHDQNLVHHLLLPCPFCSYRFRCSIHSITSGSEVGSGIRANYRCTLVETCATGNVWGRLPSCFRRRLSAKVRVARIRSRGDDEREEGAKMEQESRPWLERKKDGMDGADGVLSTDRMV